MLEHVKNHIPNLKVDGYPMNTLVGKDMTPATLTDEETGEPTNALPNTRDMASMSKLVSTDPAEVIANNGMSETPEINESEPSSASPTAEARESRNNAGNELLTNVNSGKPIETPNNSKTVNNPPNVEDDLIATQSTVSDANKPRPTSSSVNTPKVGGSLYAALLEAAGELAVPVGLTAAAISIASRKNKQQRKGTAKKLRGGAHR
jgi:hypothetical protein